MPDFSNWGWCPFCKTNDFPGVFLPSSSQSKRSRQPSQVWGNHFRGNMGDKIPNIPNTHITIFWKDEFFVHWLNNVNESVSITISSISHDDVYWVKIDKSGISQITCQQGQTNKKNLLNIETYFQGKRSKKVEIKSDVHIVQWRPSPQCFLSAPSLHFLSLRN